MALILAPELLAQLQAHGESAYPEEGAGLLLGEVQEKSRRVTRLLTFHNAREASARRNRYLLTHQDYLGGEKEAARLGLDVVGVFHSHPDHPDQPSEFDREWVMPFLSYVITSIQTGRFCYTSQHRHVPHAAPSSARQSSAWKSSRRAG